MSQTNKEFVDALDIRTEDTFLAVAVRRAAARQLGKEVVDLETETVGEPEFCSGPWDERQFVIFLEQELGPVVHIGERELVNLLSDESPDWSDGPAIKMPMKQWTELAVHRFLEPIREKITCPKDWTIFEPERGNVSTEVSGCVLICWGVLGFFFTVLSVHFGYYGIYEGLILCGGLAPLCWWMLVSNLFRRKHSTLCQLLGTITFYDDTLQFSDDHQPEGTAQILPGDYRFFLIRMEDFTPSLAVLTTLSAPPSRSDFESADDRQQFEIVIDGGIIGITELNASSPADWIQTAPGKVVYRVQQREDGTVCGIALLPTYGDGGYQVIVTRTPMACSIMVELQTPRET